MAKHKMGPHYHLEIFGKFSTIVCNDHHNNPRAGDHIISGTGGCLVWSWRHGVWWGGSAVRGRSMRWCFKFILFTTIPLQQTHNHNLKAEMWSTFEMLTQSRPVMMTHLWEFDEELSDSGTLPSADNHQMRHTGLWSQHPDVLTTPMMRLTVKTVTADVVCQSGHPVRNGHRIWNWG